MTFIKKYIVLLAIALVKSPVPTPHWHLTKPPRTITVVARICDNFGGAETAPFRRETRLSE